MATCECKICFKKNGQNWSGLQTNYKRHLNSVHHKENERKAIAQQSITNVDDAYRALDTATHKSTFELTNYIGRKLFRMSQYDDDEEYKSKLNELRFTLQMIYVKLGDITMPEPRK